MSAPDKSLARRIDYHVDVLARDQAIVIAHERNAEAGHYVVAMIDVVPAGNGWTITLLVLPAPEPEREVPEAITADWLLGGPRYEAEGTLDEPTTCPDCGHVYSQGIPTRDDESHDALEPGDCVTFGAVEAPTVKVSPAFLSDLSGLMHDEREQVFIPAQDLYVALGEPALPEPEPAKRWYVLILWAHNGWIDERTEHPWDLPNRLRLPRETWSEQPQGKGAPWTSRYVNERGDVLVITKPGGTLD